MNEKRKNSGRKKMGRSLVPNEPRPRRSDAPTRLKYASGKSGTLLAPIRLSVEEAEAIVAAFALSLEVEGVGHADAARAALAKIAAAGSNSVRARLARASANYRQPRPIDDWEELASVLNDAIRDEQELRIAYSDQGGEDTVRTIRPLAWAESRRGDSVAAWCKLRKDFRNFRLDRIVGIAALPSFFKGERDALLERYMSGDFR